jgi:hypothetical protein
MKSILFIAAVVIGLVILTACSPKMRKSSKAPKIMSGADLGKIIAKIDTSSTRDGNSVSFKVKDRDVILVFDEKADRMRILTPVVEAGSVSQDIYKRMLQANYDAVLDPRYAIANNIIWAVFIHPLSSLTEEDFVSAIVQTVTAAETFGTAYSSGAFVFGGGDSNALHEELLKELEEVTGKKDKGI